MHNGNGPGAPATGDHAGPPLPLGSLGPGNVAPFVPPTGPRPSRLSPEEREAKRAAKEARLDRLKDRLEAFGMGHVPADPATMVNALYKLHILIDGQPVQKTIDLTPPDPIQAEARRIARVEALAALQRLARPAPLVIDHEPAEHQSTRAPARDRLVDP